MLKKVYFVKSFRDTTEALHRGTVLGAIDIYSILWLEVGPIFQGKFTTIARFDNGDEKQIIASVSQIIECIENPDNVSLMGE